MWYYNGILFFPSSKKNPNQPKPPMFKNKPLQQLSMLPLLKTQKRADTKHYFYYFCFSIELRFHRRYYLHTLFNQKRNTYADQVFSHEQNINQA